YNLHHVPSERKRLGTRCRSVFGLYIGTIRISVENSPPAGQLVGLNKIRWKYTCYGCLTPLIEFIGLRAYGRKVAHTDGPTFRVSWSGGQRDCFLPKAGHFKWT